MPKLSIKAGATSETVDIFIQDPASSTGAGLTGLTPSTTGLTLYYNNPRTASTSITLATLSSPTAAYSSGGFIQRDSTNQPGIYRFDVPNTVLASGNGRYAKLYFKSPVSVPCLLEIELTGWDNQVAISSTDPWSTILPASYPSGSAGYILGHPVPSVVNSYSSGQDPAILILGATASSWNTPGTIGNKINSAASAGDPWTATLPGSYVSGSAGFIIGHNLDVATSTRQPVGPVQIGSYVSGQDPATLILDVAASSHNISGSVGQKINSAGSSADPWSTLLPSPSYPAGTAGYIIAHNLDNTISSRLPNQNVVVGSYATGQDPATSVLGATASFWNSPGTIGSAINASGASSDPWSITLPGSYASGSAGNILGNRLNAAITTRQPSGPVTISGYSINQDPATLVLNAMAASFNLPNTIGHSINLSATSADPWVTTLPGSYTPGSAGFILGHNLDAQISTRQPAGSVTLNLSTIVPTNGPANSISDCLNAARVQAFGRWNLDTLNNILYLYNYDGSLAHQFNIDNVSTPTSRS